MPHSRVSASLTAAIAIFIFVRGLKERHPLSLSPSAAGGTRASPRAGKRHPHTPTRTPFPSARGARGTAGGRLLPALSRGRGMGHPRLWGAGARRHPRPRQRGAAGCGGLTERGEGGGGCGSTQPRKGETAARLPGNPAPGPAPPRASYRPLHPRPRAGPAGGCALRFCALIMAARGHVQDPNDRRLRPIYGTDPAAPPSPPVPRAAPPPRSRGVASAAPWGRRGGARRAARPGISAGWPAGWLAPPAGPCARPPLPPHPRRRASPAPRWAGRLRGSPLRGRGGARPRPRPSPTPGEALGLPSPRSFLPRAPLRRTPLPRSARGVGGCVCVRGAAAEAGEARPRLPPTHPPPAGRPPGAGSGSLAGPGRGGTRVPSPPPVFQRAAALSSEQPPALGGVGVGLPAQDPSARVREKAWRGGPALLGR